MGMVPPDVLNFPLGAVDLRAETVLLPALRRALGLQTLPAGTPSVPVSPPSLPRAAVHSPKARPPK